MACIALPNADTIMNENPIPKALKTANSNPNDIVIDSSRNGTGPTNMNAGMAKMFPMTPSSVGYGIRSHD